MKRFTLKRMALSLVTAMMLMTSQSVMAQYFKLTALSGQNVDNSEEESIEKLVDANIATKWGTWFCSKPDATWYPNGSPAYIIVKVAEAVVPDFYFLVTGNDTKGTGRNWATWKIYGGNFLFPA